MYGAPVGTCHTTCDVEMSPCPPGRIAMYGPLRYPRLRYTMPSWNVGDGIGNWFVPPTCHKNAPVFGSYASTRSLEFTMSSGPVAASTTNGVVYDDRPLPRSVLHRSLPVRSSTARRYEAGA